MSAHVDWGLGPGEPGLVSYIMPAYNAGKYIGEALESCHAQDYRPLEAVVVDDGSTDNTPDVVKEFKEKHDDDTFSIVYIRQENAGPSAARNNGLRQSRGEVLGFLDADDLMPEGRTALLCGALDRHGATIAYGTYESIRTSKDTAKYASASGGKDTAKWEEVSHKPIVKFVPGLWNFLMRRELAEQAGPLSEEFTYSEDFEYVVRLRLQGPKMVRTEEVVHFYRKTPGSITGTPKPQNARDRLLSAKAVLKLMRDFDISDAESRRRLHHRFRRTAIECLRHGLKEEAIEAYGAAGELGRSGGKAYDKVMALISRVPLAVPALSWSLGVRLAVQESWVDFRNRTRRGGV